MERFEEVAPEELIAFGRDEFEGDMKAELPISLSIEDLRTIAEAIWNIPKGKEIIEALQIDSRDAPGLDGNRDQIIHSFLSLCQLFTQNGGSYQPDLILRARQELGQEDA